MHDGGASDDNLKCLPNTSSSPSSSFGGGDMLFLCVKIVIGASV